MSGYGKIEEDVYLLEDKVFGSYIYFHRMRGRAIIKLAALFYASAAVYYALDSYLNGTSLSDLWYKYLKVCGATLWFPTIVGTLCAVVLFNGFLFGVKKPILLELLQKVDDKCSSGALIDWREIPHSANLVSQETGGSPALFYSGEQCMLYFTRWIRNIVGFEVRLFTDDNTEVAESDNNLAKQAVQSYNAMYDSLSSH